MIMKKVESRPTQNEKILAYLNATLKRTKRQKGYKR